MDSKLLLATEIKYLFGKFLIRNDKSRLTLLANCGFKSFMIFHERDSCLNID